MSIKGIAISSGVACGPVICFPPSLPLPIATDNHVSGYSSYEKARENALQYFNEYASSQNDISTLQKDLVQCYCNILNDPAINEEIYQKINDRDEIVKLAFYRDIKDKEPIAPIDEKLLEYYSSVK